MEDNRILESQCPPVFGMLSELGKRIYFPKKGILSQGAEAKKLASRFNATIGIAVSGGHPMHLPCMDQFFQGMTPEDIYDYAPSSGIEKLRKDWRERKICVDTPGLGLISLPVVTNALTHGLSLLGDLFVDPGDEVLVANMNWENYGLNYVTRLGGRLVTYKLFKDDLSGFDVEAFRAAVMERKGKKLIVILNFPNNPTGYTPTRSEAVGIVSALVEAATEGVRMVVLCDDAYFGMFYDPECESASLFGALSQAHPHLLAVRLDGPTKEMFAWGMRVGFLTFGIKGATEAAYGVLERKTAGLIRSVLSNVTHPGQSVVDKTLLSPEFAAQRSELVGILRRRAEVVRTEVVKGRDDGVWDFYPFNSGYFMCLRMKPGVDADLVRRRLLDRYHVGTITISPTDLRVAFSCVEQTSIPELFQCIRDAVVDVRDGRP